MFLITCQIVEERLEKGITKMQIRIGPQVLVFYRNLLNLRLLFNNQNKLKLSPVFK